MKIINAKVFTGHSFTDGGIEFDQKILENETFGKVTVSSGMAVYNPSEHDNFHSVFENADKQMYRNKQKMKGSRAQYTSREVA